MNLSFKRNDKKNKIKFGTIPRGSTFILSNKHPINLKDVYLNTQSTVFRGSLEFNCLNLTNNKLTYLPYIREVELVDLELNVE